LGVKKEKLCNCPGMETTLNMGGVFLNPVKIPCRWRPPLLGGINTYDSAEHVTPARRKTWGKPRESETRKVSAAQHKECERRQRHRNEDEGQLGRNG